MLKKALLATLFIALSATTHAGDTRKQKHALINEVMRPQRSFDGELIKKLTKHVAHNLELFDKDGFARFNEFVDHLQRLNSPNALLLRVGHQMSAFEKIMPEYEILRAIYETRISQHNESENLRLNLHNYRQFMSGIKGNNLLFIPANNSTYNQQLEALDTLGSDALEYVAKMTEEFSKIAVLKMPKSEHDDTFNYEITRSITLKHAHIEIFTLFIDFFERYTDLIKLIKKERIEIMLILIEHDVLTDYQIEVDESIYNLKHMSKCLSDLIVVEQKKSLLSVKEIFKTEKKEKLKNSKKVPVVTLHNSDDLKRKSSDKKRKMHSSDSSSPRNKVNKDSIIRDSSGITSDSELPHSDDPK
jgi:hypothetical protein